jgi:hypothetical protein
VTTGRDPGGHDQGLGHHVVQVEAKDFQIGGVEVDLGELDMAEDPLLEHRHLGIEPAADPGHLAAGDPTYDPHRRGPGRRHCASSAPPRKPER